MPGNFLRYNQVGQSGLKVSSLSLGGWLTFGGSVTNPNLGRELIRTAFEAGINFYDIADIYAKGAAERFMGEILSEFPRHELVISSKVFWPMSQDINDAGLSRKHIMESVNRSLKRIGTDYLDMYFCHRFDESTPLSETAHAMSDLVRQGKILYWGTSEWTGAQLREVHRICAERGLYAPTVEQPQYNLLHQRVFCDDVAPACQSLGMGAVTWSPLASGALTGKYNNGIPQGSRLEHAEWLRAELLSEDRMRRIERFTQFAAKVGHECSQLAIAWSTRHPAVSSVILGSSQLSQLKQNLGAVHINLSETDLKELEAIFAGC